MRLTLRIVVWVIGAVLIITEVVHRTADGWLPVRLPPSTFEVDADSGGGVVTASGTWITDGVSRDIDLQTSLIQCRRVDMVCRETRAEIRRRRGLVLGADTTTHRVTSWSDGGVAFASETVCADLTYALDFSAKSVTGSRRPKRDAPRDRCASAATEAIFRLEDGEVVWERMRNERVPKLFRTIAFWR